MFSPYSLLQERLKVETNFDTTKFPLVGTPVPTIRDNKQCLPFVQIVRKYAPVLL